MDSDYWTLREIGGDCDGEWDRLAGQCPESGFMQSSAWAAFKRGEGYSTRRFGLFAEGELRGGAALMAYPAAGREGFLICPEGPVLPWDEKEHARDGLRKLIRAARELSETLGGLGLRIEAHLPRPRPSLLRNWTRAPVDLTPVQTLMLDLTMSEPEIRGAMSPKGRYNLGLAERHGVRVVQSEQMQDLAGFYSLFEETARRNEFFAEPYGFFLNMGEALFPARQAAIFIAEWEGAPIAAILVIFFGRRATYLYGGSSAVHREVMPNYLLHWAAMREARERGCVEYDLYGYDPYGIPNHQYAGISRFKKQFGGERHDWIGAHDLIFYDRLAGSLVESLNKSETTPNEEKGPPAIANGPSGESE